MLNVIKNNQSIIELGLCLILIFILTPIIIDFIILVGNNVGTLIRRFIEEKIC